MDRILVVYLYMSSVLKMFTHFFLINKRLTLISVDIFYQGILNMYLFGIGVLHLAAGPT